MAKSLFDSLKTAYPNWDLCLGTSRKELEAIIKPGGLQQTRAGQIRGALSKIRSDFGAIELSALKGWDEASAEAYLTSLPGVSLKIAKCVMVYTLGFSVMPVDTHIYRVAKRLGWTEKNRADQCHGELEALVPAHRRHDFHVACMAHGQQTCSPRGAECERCCISDYCLDYNNRPRPS